MKNAIGTIVLCVIVSAGVLFAYDWFIVRPRVRQAQADVQTLDKIMAPQNRMADTFERVMNRLEREIVTESPGNNARLNALVSSLQTVRSQLELYKVQHNDEYPSLFRFTQQMTGQTDQAGGKGSDFGPYLHDIPTNPFTEGNKVGCGDYGTSDWFYNEKTGEFRANDTAEHAGY